MGLSNLPEYGRYRGEKIALVDAQMMLTRAELDEVEVEVDGNWVRVFRDADPDITSDGSGTTFF
jgi:hypothetical protein